MFPEYYLKLISKNSIKIESIEKIINKGKNKTNKKSNKKYIKIRHSCLFLS